ncbi:DUF2934 domain-containing protein [Rhizobium sp. GR12]|uniref:DUF2934 domain-containing protein n=1 Tax=Rhizobium sp. GR12 TaxID=3053925 RepID=UPI002FBF1043
MVDKEQQRRERAYKSWEDEGRVAGNHEDHWARADDQDGITEAEAAEITEVNQQASEEFDKGSSNKRSATDINPPSVASSD